VRRNIAILALSPTSIAMIAFTSKWVLTPTERLRDAVVLVEGQTVIEVTTQESIQIPENARVTDFGDRAIAPGLVDIHIHGAAGHDVMHEGESGRAKMEQFLARHGVTSYYPTTVTATVDQIQSALERLADSIESSSNGAGRAQALGIHLEGPFLSHVRRGMHAAENLVQPSLKAFERFWQASRGHIRVMTIAPELESAEEVITEATRRGVCVSMGHSDADVEATRRGIRAGAHHATHTFNAMRPLDHREPGIIGEVLTDKQVTADIIADGIHVNPAIVALLLRAKGPEGAVLITDATSATGMPDGVYDLGPVKVEVKGGACVKGQTLAGSILTLDRAVRNAMKFASWDLQDAVRAASLNPAKTTLSAKKGTIAAGADADFVVLTSSGEVATTVIKGTVIQ
jgi:N-acetylglucosamine-6-phosphate deacetylase